MENKEFSRKLEGRTEKFAISIIRLSSLLPEIPEGIVIRRQITKSGTSIGANYREANRARSRADFRNKIRICEGEASETQYWINIIVRARWLKKEQVSAVYNECSELIAIFTSTGKNAT